MLTNVKYWLWLTDLLPAREAWQVFVHFGTPEHAYFSDPGEVEQIEGLSPEMRQLLLNRDVRPAEDLLNRCDMLNIRILTFNDTDYPERLRNIEYPPLVLYLRGRMLRFDDRAVVAMVGTRKASDYGRKLSRTIARDLSQAGAIVATGLVMGCDLNAAYGALQGGGPLALVVAGGVDVPYYNTPNGRELLKDGAAYGCILSESPPGTPHEGARFRRRNIILTGLSCAVLCVEGDMGSGAVRVAEMASELGRDVFAIPGNLGSSLSRGTNDLLRQQIALPVVSAQDILCHYDYLLPRNPPKRSPQVKSIPCGTAKTPSVKKAAPQDSSPPREHEEKKNPEEKKGVDTVSNTGYIELLNSSSRWSDAERSLLTLLVNGPATAEALVADSGLATSLANATLVMLVVNGAVEEVSGGRYRIRPEGLKADEG